MAKRKKLTGLNQENSNQFLDDDKKKKKKKVKKTKGGDLVDKSTGLTLNPSNSVTPNPSDEEKPKKKKKSRIKKDAGGNLVDTSTGLTETAPIDQGKETEDAKKLREYEERSKNKPKVESVTKLVPQTPSGNIIERDSTGEIKITDKKAKGKQQTKVYRDGEEIEPQEYMDRANRKAQASGLDLSDLDLSYKDPNAEAKEVLGADATEEEIADYNMERDHAQKNLSALESVLQEEASNNAKSQEELQQGYDLAREVSKQTRKKNENQEEEEKEEQKRASSLISIISKKLPNLDIEAISNMKPKDIFKLAAKAGLAGKVSNRQKRLANNYIDTVQTLGVQDYFPNVADKIAVGTFTGSRIGSQTIYSGAGGLAPMGLYDAKRRALKEKLKMSQKAIQNNLKFDQVPPPYNDIYQGAMARAYKDIMSNTDLDETERQLRLGQLEGFAREITYAYNTAKNINERSLETRNDQKDKIFIPKEIKNDMQKFMYAYFDEDYMDKAARGEVNLAQEVSKLRFYDNLIQSTKDLAKDFSQFKKTRLDGDFISGLTKEQLEDLQKYQRNEELSNAATDVLIKRYTEFYAEDLDQAFKDAFYEGKELQAQYDPGQEEQAKRLFKQMLAPSIKEDLKSISTGLGARLTAARENKKMGYQYMYEEKISVNDNKQFADIASDSDDVNDFAVKLATTGTVRENATSFKLGYGVVAVERPAPSTDFYIKGQRLQRDGVYKLRVRIGGSSSTELKTPQEVLQSLNNNVSVVAADGGATIDQEMMNNFIKSLAGGDATGTVGPAKFLLTAHSEAPVYIENNTAIGIKNDASLQKYKDSSEKSMLWQDFGKPVYQYTSGGVTREREFPFLLQGDPYVANKREMQSLDSEFSRTGAPTRDYE